jgi:hypothetical protein
VIVVIIQLCKAKVLFPQTQVIVVIMELCKAKVLFPQTQVIVANFGYPVWVLLNYLIFQSFMFEHTRNASCALNLISTIFFYYYWPCTHLLTLSYNSSLPGQYFQRCVGYRLYVYASLTHILQEYMYVLNKQYTINIIAYRDDNNDELHGKLKEP